VLLGKTLDSHTLTSTGLSPSTAPHSNGLRLRDAISYCLTRRQTGTNAPTTPHAQPLPGITRTRFSLLRFRSPLLSESLLFSLPVGTEMFHFPTFPPHTLYIQVQVTGHDSSWVSPFGHPRITARLPTPQGLSQAPTSFIGSWCQGIHHVPFIACLTNTQQKLQRHLQIASTNTPTTTPPNKGAGTVNRGIGQMLASTLHMSKHQPTNPTRTQQHPDGKGGTRPRCSHS
jgi:hypothetical protein